MARADMICEHVHDISSKLPYKEPDARKREKLFEEAMKCPLGTGLKLVENFVEGSGYFVGDGVSIADIFFAVGCEWLTAAVPTALNATPKLTELVERVRNLPNIKAWIERRPNTPF